MKQLNIEIPEGYIVDEEKSDLSKGVLKFKEVEKELMSYEVIAKKMFAENPACYIRDAVTGCIVYVSDGLIGHYEGNEATSKEQLESLLALNKLINVAKYLNGDWFPIERELKWFHGLTAGTVGSFYKDLIISKHESVKYSCVYFKTRTSAEMATKILGEDVIKKALTLQHR